jgi:hypothetical protein
VSQLFAKLDGDARHTTGLNGRAMTESVAWCLLTLPLRLPVELARRGWRRLTRAWRAGTP